MAKITKSNLLNNISVRKIFVMKNLLVVMPKKKILRMTRMK